MSMLTTPAVPPSLPRTPGGSRMLLPNVSWAVYTGLSADLVAVLG